MIPPEFTYVWLGAAALAVSVVFWLRLARRDLRLVFIFAAAILGGLIGAKLLFLAAEGWQPSPQSDGWVRRVRGKSILGGLLGGYAAVELAKYLVRYPVPTGDLFARVVSVGIIIARLACLACGCCAGIACRPAWYTLEDSGGASRWPAVPIEIGFNVLMLVVDWAMRRRGALRGQYLHIYLMAYAVFRFGHQYCRDILRVIGPLSGYQVAAASIFLLRLGGFIRRSRGTKA